MMNMHLEVATQGRGFYELNAQLQACLNQHSQPIDGVLNIFVQHTSASLIVCENADPDVLSDLAEWMEGLVQDGDARFRHRAEGRDDMAAHIRSVLTCSSLTLPVRAGRLSLGTWQGVFLWEHRYAAHKRRLVLNLLA